MTNETRTLFELVLYALSFAATFLLSSEQCEAIFDLIGKKQEDVKGQSN